VRNFRSILVLVAVLLAAAVPALAQDAGNSGFTWVLNGDSTGGMLYVQNPEGLPVLKLDINSADVAISGFKTLVADYLYVVLPAGEEIVAITVTAKPGKTIDLVSAELVSAGTAFTVSGTKVEIDYVGEPANAVVVNLMPTAGVFAALAVNDSYVLKADGTMAMLALVTGDARSYDFGTNGVGDIVRIWLPVTIGNGEKVVLLFDAAPKVFGVAVGYQRPDPVLE